MALNGTNLGVEAPSISFTSVAATNAGTYTLVARNSYGSATSAPITLVVEEVQVFVDGANAFGSFSTFLPPVQISLTSAFQGGDMFYTLDGSKPDLASTPYMGPFEVSAGGDVHELHRHG